MGTLNTTAREMKPGDMLLAIASKRERYPKVLSKTPDNHLDISDILHLSFIGYWNTSPWHVLIDEEPVQVLRPETIRERARVYTWLAKNFSRLIGTGREWEDEGGNIAKLMHLMEHGCEAENLDVYILRVISRYDRCSAESAARYVSYMA